MANEENEDAHDLHDKRLPSAAESEEFEINAAWGNPTKSREGIWGPAVATVLAAILWFKLPPLFVTGPLIGVKFVVPGLELLLLVPLTYTRVSSVFRGTRISRSLSIGLIAVISATNLLSLIELIHFLLSRQTIGGTKLLGSAADIWVTNVIVFALWFWELDRGGPYLRHTDHHRQPDFLFPQMATPYVEPGWAPDFIDYLYVSFTNATAFSPTDTMPLTNWAKLLMMVQSLASLITVGLVAARAVNILR